jgi:NAD(P)-dependent dehydrogenase (short-subunit alcohol dehydrogenase family)
MSPIIDSDSDDWMKGWDVKTKCPYLCCHNLLLMILASEAKTIINLSSIGVQCISSGAMPMRTEREETRGRE